MCLTVFFAQPLSKSSLDYLLLHTPYNSWPSHCLFLQSYHCSLFCCSTEIMSSIPSLSQFYTRNSVFYLNFTHPSDHSHLCPLNYHLIFISYRPSLTSMQHTTSHTTAVHSVQSPSHNQSFILVSNITNCLNLCHPIWILAFTAASASSSTLKVLTK